MPDPETVDLPVDGYDPSDVEVTRGRMQGLGVGARDLQRQRDPDRDLASDLDVETPTEPDDSGS